MAVADGDGLTLAQLSGGDYDDLPEYIAGADAEEDGEADADDTATADADAA